MSTIRHICGGHEYRYDTITGAVTDNYGMQVASLAFCRFTGIALLHRDPGEKNGKKCPTTAEHFIASKRDLPIGDDEAAARFASGQYATNTPGH